MVLRGAIGVDTVSLDTESLGALVARWTVRTCLSVSQVIHNLIVMSSAAEAETSALFMNAQEAVHLRTILTALGWKQPQTTMITDNNTAIGFANNTIKQAKSKSWDMNTNWLKCHEAQHQFQSKWEE